MLGDIVSDLIVLNDIGGIVNRWIQTIPDKYPGISLDKYVIMPNHIHFVIHIDVGARSSRPINQKNPQGRDDPAPTLGKMIAWFKYQSTKQINALNDRGYVKLWQRNYWDHIIRNEKEYYAITQYIMDNPKNWEQDTLFI